MMMPIVLPKPQPGVLVYNVPLPPVPQDFITSEDVGKAIVFQHDVLEQYKQGNANLIAVVNAAMYAKRLLDVVSPPPQVAYLRRQFEQMQASQESIRREMRAVAEEVHSLREKVNTLQNERGSD